MTDAISTHIKKYMHLEFVRFLGVGVTNTVLGQLLYWVFLEALPYQLAYSAATVIGIVISYVLNSVFVFHEPLRWSKFLQFPLVYLVQYLLGLVIITLVVDGFGIDERFASIIAVILTIPATFFLSRLIIARRIKDPDLAEV